MHLCSKKKEKKELETCICIQKKKIKSRQDRYTLKRNRKKSFGSSTSVFFNFLFDSQFFVFLVYLWVYFYLWVYLFSTRAGIDAESKFRSEFLCASMQQVQILKSQLFTLHMP